MPKKEQQTEFGASMSEWDDEWQDAQASSFDTLPNDWKGQATIKISRLEANDEGVYRWSMMYAAPDGTAWDNQNLDNEIGRKIGMQNARALGYEGESWAEFEQWVESGAPLEQVCQIRVKVTPGDTRDFTNVYLNRVVHQATPDDQAAAAADDDIPF